MNKKFLLPLLVLAVLFTATTKADADTPYTVTSDDVTFYITISDATCTITNSTGGTTEGTDSYSGDITVPEKLTYSDTEYTVTSIGSYAFYGCTSLESVSLPSTVTSIESYAFYNCTSLTSVSLPSTVTSIGTFAFYSCSSLTSVGDLSSTSLTSIGIFAFYGCSSLTSVSLPSTVTSIGTSAFRECSSLTSVGDLSSTSLTSISSSAFYGCSSLTSVGDLSSTSLTSIGSYAFYGCSSLKSVSLPSTVTSIGPFAFYGCSSLTSVGDLSSTSLTSIGTYTFGGCSSRTSVSLPSTVTSIGQSTFYGCSSLTSISLPSTVTSIGDYAFSGCTGMETVKIYAPSLETYGSNVFATSSSDASLISGLKVCVLPYSLSTYAEGWSGNFSILRPFHDRSIGSSLGATTVCLPYDAAIPDGCTAYKVTGGTVNGTVTLEAAEDSLTADVPYIVELTDGGDVCFYGNNNDTPTEIKAEGAAETDTYTDYIMKGVYTAETVYAPKGSYVLQNQTSYGTAFYYVANADKIKVGQFKGYISLDSDSEESSGAPLSIVYADGEEATGISNAGVAANCGTTSADTNVYNLQGVRVSDSTGSLPKGIYIRGGKKFVVR